MTAQAQSPSSQQDQELPEWDLNDLYPGPYSEEFTTDLSNCEKSALTFKEKWQGKLAEMAAMRVGGKMLAQAIREYELLSDSAGHIGSYAQLYHVGDTTDPARSKFYGDVQGRMNALSTNLLFFELELNRIDDKDMNNCLQTKELAHYQPWLKNLRKERPHQLDDCIEELFHEKSLTSAAAWNRLFDETMASLTFDIDGKELSLEPTLSMMTSPDAKKRRKGAEALSKTLKQNQSLFSTISNTLAKDKEIYDRWHKFEDIADSRHLANRVEQPVVNALVDAVVAAYPDLSHRYYAMKAKWFGVEKLDHWDRNAPLPDEDTREIKWADAKDVVLEAYNGFAPEMADIARKFFDKNWIDAPVRKGKASGAFAHPTVPSAHPYVLLNYQGKSRDVMTLAHELGHGVHQVLAAEQGALMAPTPLTLAETASVFGEMLTFQKMLEQTSDTKTRKIMLASKVEDMLNTVVRQISFYCFEREVHQQRRNGELTAKQIGQIWLDISRQSLGPAIELHDGYEVFWAYIPHFIHAPFYVYAYAFGDCLVNSLYARYQQGDAAFTEKYFNLLKAGGSKHHSELLKPFDLDASDPAFWQMGLSVIKDMIDEIERLDT